MKQSAILGTLVYGASALLKETLRIQIHTDFQYSKTQPSLFAFWHGKQWLPVVTLAHHHQTPAAVLVSPSRDGDILSAWLKHYGYEVVRGSSRRDNYQALKGLIRKAKAGYSIGFGVDGPIGPIHQVKPGMTYLAQKFGIPIVPVGSAFECKWIFKKAWDQYEMPKPFSRASFYLGKPLFVKPTDDLISLNQQLETSIHQAEQMAFEWLSS